MFCRLELISGITFLHTIPPGGLDVPFWFCTMALLDILILKTTKWIMCSLVECCACALSNAQTISTFHKLLQSHQFDLAFPP